MTKLDATAEAHLKVFEAAWAVYKTAEKDREATLREQLDAEIGGLRIDASKAANRAVAAGVPITKLGDKARHGMQTKNFNTIRAFLDLTVDLVNVTAEDLYVDPLDERYSFAPQAGVLTVTIDAETLAKHGKDLGWTPQELADPERDFSRATFTLETSADTGVRYLRQTVELALKEDGWRMHPAVSWVTRYKEHEAEALAYAVAHAQQ